ncbi:MAG TPA: HAMP domain-containing sensor histidine kinase [Vicinamibacteria bacterium]|nr:HAMP domain-containing sensor histidine kinase [Vicinamibacteria bacterium]
MKGTVEKLTEAYALALEDYLKGAGEEALLRAYQIGREAVSKGLGVLEIAAVHQDASVAVLLKMLAPPDSSRVARSASEFFAEALAPFEMTRMGFREANAILQDLNAELEERVQATLRDYEAARDQLEEYKRLERMKSEFISMVSHELRTPLSSIHGSLNMVLDGLRLDLPPGVQRLLEIAYRNSQRLVRLVNDILDSHKLGLGEMVFEIQRVDLVPLLHSAIEANQVYFAQRGVRLVLQSDLHGADVAADPDRLMQVLTNLLANAGNFSPRGETVELHLDRVVGWVRVSVSDRGPGIPEDFRTRVFQKFAQADASATGPQTGTGLGLSITKAIMEGLGGRISFESEVGRGTTFHIELPEWREDSAAAKEGLNQCQSRS